MGTVVKYDNIFQYNESRGVETLHPLVSVIDFSKAEPIPPGHYRRGAAALRKSAGGLFLPQRQHP